MERDGAGGVVAVDRVGVSIDRQITVVRVATWALVSVMLGTMVTWVVTGYWMFLWIGLSAACATWTLNFWFFRRMSAHWRGSRD